MPHPDATGEFSQLPERFAHKEGLIFPTCNADLLNDPGKIGVAEPIGLVANAGRPLTEGIESPSLLGVLEMVHLLGETDHERVDFQLEIRILFAQRANGFSSLFHSALIGHQERQLNRIEPKASSLARRRVKKRQTQLLS